MRQILHITALTLSLCILSGFKIVFAGDDVAINGFVSQGYLRSSENNFLTDSNQGSFEFDEIGINFSYNPGSNVTVGAQLFARDLGDVGEDKVTVNWAFGDYKWQNWMGLRAGIMKFDIGLYNNARDIDSLRTSILLPQSVYNEWFRDVGQGIKGVQMYGKVPIGAAGQLDYQLQVSNVQIPLDSGTAQYILMSTPSITSLDSIDIDTAYSMNLRWYTPLDGLLLGISGYRTNLRYNINDSTLIYESNDFRTGIVSVEYTWRSLTLASEFKQETSRDNVYPTGDPGFKIVDGDRQQNTNYYFSGSYQFTDWFEAGLYYSKGEASHKETGPANELKDTCLSTRFNITPNFVFKLETHFMNGFYGAVPGTDGSLHDTWNLYAAKASYTF